MNYGEKIRYIRVKVRGMTLTDLHNKTGLSISYLSDSENGKCEMSIKALERVSDALKVTSSFLLDARNMTLENLADLHNVDIPDDLKAYMMKKKSLPYISLIKSIDENGTFSLEFLKKLIELHENESKKGHKS